MSEKERLSASDLTAAPFFVESGEREVHLTLGAGEKCRAAAFVVGVGESSSARFSLTVDLTGPGAEFHLDALFVAVDDSRAAIDVRVNHLAPECVSRQLVKGVAAGNAAGAFTGMVHVAPGAQKTDASQRNQNLQLSDTARITSLPRLEIYADDVKCGHGATVGKLDDTAIFYMRQRGISEAEARRMQLHGFADEIVDRVASESAREPIRAKIAALIDRL